MPWKFILFSILFGGCAVIYKHLYGDFPIWIKNVLKDSIDLLTYNFNLKQTSSYDPYYAMFVLQWPVSVCIFEVIEKRRGRGYKATEEDCRFPRLQHSWTIHGIWNSRSSGSRCSATPLKRSDIESLTVELNERWVQVRKYFENFNFWEYEWNKHGTCLLEHENLNEAKKYFQQAVMWHRQFDPTSTLLACGMPPDDRKTYSNVEMTKCLRDRLNITSRIILSTRNDYSNRGGTSLLREIRICFNRNFTLADCESSDPHSFDFIYPRTVENK